MSILQRLASLLIPTIAGCAVVCDSCSYSFDSIRGSGTPKTEQRTVSQPFRKISLQGSIDLAAHVGPTASVQITADDNLLQYFYTRVENGELLVGMEDGSYSMESTPILRVTLPELEAVHVSGSSDVVVEGARGPSLSLSISGSGDFDVGGQVDELTVSISGSGDMALDDLVARDATVQVRGSGDVRVHATDNLKISISGSGDVIYSGQPAVTTSISGSGDVSRR